MTLTTDAERAEDIGHVFIKFRDYVPDHAPEITASLEELYEIGFILRELDAAFHSPLYGQNFVLVDKDLELVCSCLNDSLQDIFHILGDIGNGSLALTSSMYRQNWRDIALHFKKYEGISLKMRLEKYKRFMMELANIVKQRTPQTDLIGGLRGEIEGLGPAPDRLTQRLNEMTLGTKTPLAKPRSYERHRPVPTSSPPMQPYYRAHTPPSVPDVPASSSTATQTTSQSSGTDLDTGHWARTMLWDTSITPLPITGDTSRCYGVPDPEARQRLKHGFEEVTSIDFAGQSGLSVRLYLREEDYRARIFCKWPRRSGRGFKCSCLPLNQLEFYRDKSSLKVCRKRPGSSKVDLWANLNFSTIERMVIFYCTLVSLRGHDAGRPVTQIHDHELDGEKPVFEGQIVDDNYLHKLHIYQDSQTNAVRLHASIFNGDMKRTPVWTAFITHLLVSRTWLISRSPALVCLRELRRHIFSSEYDPQLSPGGEHFLKFSFEADAEAFVKVINELAGLYARPSPHPHPPPPVQRTNAFR